MDPSPRSDLLRFYSRYYAPGIVDLSSSSPPPEPLDVPVDERVQPEGLCYVPPAGPAELRERIAARCETVGAEDVLITAGASEALAAIALALSEPGMMVTHDRGTYPSFIEAARTAGAEVRLSDEALPGATLAARCHPTAPDGQVFDIGAWCRRGADAGAVPVVDEVYRDLPHDGRAIPAAADCCDRALSIGGLSKPLGMGGLRIGWIATRDAALREQLDRQLQLLSGGPASLSVTAALAAFECYDRATAATLAAVRENAPRIHAVLAAAGWTWTEPQAGLTVEARPPHTTSEQDDERMAAAGYFLVPGEVYATPGSYRVSLLADPAALTVAARILAELYR